MPYLNISRSIRADHPITPAVYSIKQAIVDDLIAHRGISPGILVNLAVPKTFWPQLKAEIQRLMIDDDAFVQLMARYSIDIRLDDTLNLAPSERLYFPFERPAPN